MAASKNSEVIYSDGIFKSAGNGYRLVALTAENFSENLSVKSNAGDYIDKTFMGSSSGEAIVNDGTNLTTGDDSI